MLSVSLSARRFQRKPRGVCRKPAGSDLNGDRKPGRSTSNSASCLVAPLTSQGPAAVRTPPPPGIPKLVFPRAPRPWGLGDWVTVQGSDWHKAGFFDTE